MKKSQEKKNSYIYISQVGLTGSLLKDGSRIKSGLQQKKKEKEKKSDSICMTQMRIIKGTSRLIHVNINII